MTAWASLNNYNRSAGAQDAPPTPEPYLSPTAQTSTSMGLGKIAVVNRFDRLAVTGRRHQSPEALSVISRINR